MYNCIKMLSLIGRVFFFNILSGSYLCLIVKLVNLVLLVMNFNIYFEYPRKFLKCFYFTQEHIQSIQFCTISMREK